MGVGTILEHGGACAVAEENAGVAVFPINNGRKLFGTDDEDGVVGCLQLTFLPGMSYQGSWIAQVEGVRVDRSMRGEGIGEEMMKFVIAKSRERDCKHIQLMTDKRRTDAQRFYERLGFEMSHEGMKLAL